MDARLLVGALADLFVAGVFATVGYRLSRRSVAPEAKRAARGFNLWWAGIALVWTIDAARGFAIAGGVSPQSAAWDAFLLGQYAFIIVLCVALTGLLTYLLFVFTGRDLYVPLAAFYGAYVIVALLAMTTAQPSDIRIGTWATHVVYANDLAPATEATFFLFLLVPQLGGAAAYLSLARRTTERERKFRILVVGTSLLVWIGVNLAADLAGWTYADAWQVARRALALVASIAILLAYDPPAWLRARVAREVPA